MLLKKYAKNTEGKDYVVGDIHGCFSLLEDRLREIGFDKTKDRLFSCGDLVDRGPESHLAAEYILDRAWFHAVRGNHEDMIYTADMHSHLQNGGAWWYLLDEQEQAIFRLAFNELPLAIEVETDDGTVGIIHAEVPGHDWHYLSVAGAAELDMLEHYGMWGRREVRQYRENGTVPAPVAGIDKVYVGHSIIKGGAPLRLANINYIDTGAFATGVLTIERIQ